MNRFIFSLAAGQDVDGIAEYLASLPKAPANEIGRALQRTLRQLAKNPEHAHLHEEMSELLGEPVRSFVEGDYVIFLAATRRPVAFLGVLHGKRDIQSIMQQRLR